MSEADILMSTLTFVIGIGWQRGIILLVFFAAKIPAILAA